MAWTLMLCIVVLGSVLTLRQANAVLLLDCTSQIRLYFPHLFTHCNTVCQYSEWSDWQMVSGSTANVLTSECPSGEAYTERRTRFSSEFDYYIQGCTNTTQSRQICKLLHSICNFMDNMQFYTPSQVCPNDLTS